MVIQVPTAAPDVSRLLAPAHLVRQMVLVAVRMAMCAQAQRLATAVARSASAVIQVPTVAPDARLHLEPAMLPPRTEHVVVRMAMSVELVTAVVLLDSAEAPANIVEQAASLLSVHVLRYAFAREDNAYFTSKAYAFLLLAAKRRRGFEKAHRKLLDPKPGID